MADAVLELGYVGPLVTVQDAGRPGRARFGVPASGPMDRHSFAIAQRALGLGDGAAGIEVSLGGLDLTCRSGAVRCAVTGGGFVLTHGETKLRSWSMLTLRAGDRLSIRRGEWGAWAYLAFAGSLETEQWLGSAATHAPSGFGGGMLRQGQRLTIRDAQAFAGGPAALPRPVSALPRHRLRVVPGPQMQCFAPGALAALTGGAYRVTPSVDRMGMRLEGPELALASALSIPSEPVLRGALQVAGDGMPTALMADHGTTGGYPRIGTILPGDLDAFAQSRPGDLVEFVAVTPEEAVMETRRRAEAAARYLARISARYGPAGQG